MKKLFRLSMLAMHRGTYIKSRSFVWFLMTIFVPGVICMYWIVAIRQNPSLARSMSTSFLVTYYLTVVTMASLLVSHIKDHISVYDIQQGELSQYLLRPFSYYLYKVLFEELPYRVIQGGYGVLVIVMVAFVFPTLISYNLSPATLALTAVSMIMGFLICFTLEMVLGLMAFWLYDMKLFHSAYEVLFILLGGWNMPIFLFPKALYTFALFTPFPAVVYVPTLFLTGKIPLDGAHFWLLYQTLWFVIIFLVYKAMWHYGVKKFTAAGI